MRHRIFALKALAVLAVFALFFSSGCSDSDRAGGGQHPQETKKSGIDPSWFDTSVDPREDFYQYAVGGWRKAHPIPANKSAITCFDLLREKTNQQLTELLEQMAAGNSLTSPCQGKSNSDLKRKLGDFFASGMDTEAIEKAGVSPLQPTLDSIQSIASVDDIPSAIGELHQQGIFPYFKIGSQVDDKNNTRMILCVDQGGLGLPSRDYYVSEESREKEIMAKYRQHVAKMFVLAGDDATTAETEADAVIALETSLAKASLSDSERSDPEAIYHLMSLDELQQLTPDFPWDAYIAGVELDTVGDINVAVPDFMSAMSEEIFRNSSLEENLAYMRWVALNSAAPYLSQAFVDEDFDFNSTVLNGISQQNERRETVTATINADGIMGYGLGEAYVEKYFDPQTKEMVESTVAFLTQAMEARIPHLEWMVTPETQQEALNKLHNIVTKVGYPAKNRDYSGLDINRDSYYGNVSRAKAFEMRRKLDLAGQPVDKDAWEMTPQTVNAYYEPTRNEIVFPAAILQAPFFDPEVDDAANFGAIGAVIAHEMSHGYDTTGSAYDAQGNMRDWWQPEEHTIFNKLTQGIKDQYSEYKVNDTPLDGNLVCGEAIADLNGVSLALQAYELAWQGKQKPVIDGFTAYERFFLSFAQIWATNRTQEDALRRVKTDPHPPANYRVNGTMSNNFTFFETFHVQKGDPMRRDDDKITYMW